MCSSTRIELVPFAFMRQFLEDHTTAVVERTAIDIFHIEQTIVDEWPSLPA
jgi:hypothetical protein